MLLLASLAQAETYTVDPSGSTPGSYPSFGDLPSLWSGDVVVLVAGTWTGSSLGELDNAFPLTLRGDGRNLTTLQGYELQASTGSLVVEDIRLEDSTLNAGHNVDIDVVLRRVDLSLSEDTMVGLEASSTASLEIYDSTFTGGKTAIDWRAGWLLLDHVTISGTAGRGARLLPSGSDGIVSLQWVWVDGAQEGGILASNGGNVEIDHCTFTNNRSFLDGAGLKLFNLTSVSVTNSHFSNNSTTASGGGLYVNEGDLTLSNNTFEDNEAAYGGGLTAFYSSSSSKTWEVSELYFEGNNATGIGGGGAWLTGRRQAVTGLTFVNNSSAGRGGGVYDQRYDAADAVKIQDSLFINNTAESGGGAYGPRVHTSDFFGNSATDNGGSYTGSELSDVRIDNSTAARGGAVSGTKDGLRIDGLVVTNSTATSGDGGAILSDETRVEINFENLRIHGNSACGNGGGISIDLLHTLAFHDAQIWDNQANTCGSGGDGGGLWARSLQPDNEDIDVSGLYICGNSAENAGGMYFKNGQNFTLSNLALTHNTATGTGGGAWLRRLEGVTLEQSVFLGNTAAAGGGLYVQLARLDIVNSVFAYTLAGDGLTMTSSAWADATVSYSNFYENLSDDVGGTDSSVISGNNNLSVDPGFASFTADGDCSNEALWLSSSSALSDAGSGVDSDGSTGDIGVHGGLDAWERDQDGDGIDYVSDCDDGDPATFPGGTEVCGGLDEDCDGTVDESGASGGGTWYLDSDEDGYGDPAQSLEGCVAPNGYVGNATDCDDTDSSINPGANEICDGQDNDCDGQTDPADSWDVTAFHVDADGDGFGAESQVMHCTASEGLSTQDGDCEDDQSEIYPGAVEIPYDGIDQDCDGADLCDVDDDGLDAVECDGTDCDDSQVGPCDTGGTDSGETGDLNGPDSDSNCHGCSGQGGGSLGWLSVGLLALALRRREKASSRG